MNDYTVSAPEQNINKAQQKQQFNLNKTRTGICFYCSWQDSVSNAVLQIKLRKLA